MKINNKRHVREGCLKELSHQVNLLQCLSLNFYHFIKSSGLGPTERPAANLWIIQNNNRGLSSQRLRLILPPLYHSVINSDFKTSKLIRSIYFTNLSAFCFESNVDSPHLKTSGKVNSDSWGSEAWEMFPECSRNVFRALRIVPSHRFFFVKSACNYVVSRMSLIGPLLFNDDSTKAQGRRGICCRIYRPYKATKEPWPMAKSCRLPSCPLPR